jgi:HK97 gp10 family phage protein
VAKRVAQNITIEGLDEVIATLKDVTPREAINLARSTVHAIAGRVRDEIRKDAPVDTGALRKSIASVRRRGTKTTVQSDVVIKPAGFPWIWQEFGSVKQPARPFITPVVEETRPKIPEIYRREFGIKLERALARKAKKAKGK